MLSGVGLALTAWVVIGTFVYKLAGFLMNTVFGGRLNKFFWFKQALLLVIAVLVTFGFQLDILPVLAPVFGGHLAPMPLWVAYIITAIVIAAIAEGAVSVFQGVFPAAITTTESKSRFW